MAAIAHQPERENRLPLLGGEVLRLAGLGWLLFPVRDKQPLVVDWPHQATSDLARLEFWSKRFTGCNWGAVTGEAAGFFVLDVDGQDGIESLAQFERAGQILPQTLTARTGRGCHLYFLWPDGLGIRNSAGKLAAGLDVRAEGGYVIVPPSVHPTGIAYKFIDESVPIAAPPEWLLGMLRRISAAGSHGPMIGTASLRANTISEGRRNSTLMSHAGSMRRKGAAPAAIEAALLVLNVDCVPPLDPREVKAIAHSVCRYEPAAPRRGAAAELLGREWPAPLGDEAFHGLAGEFVRLVGPETESDGASLLFSFLVTLGSIVGRGPHYQVGGDRHYTNLFAVIVGESAKARKGTSWGEVRRFVELLDEDWCKQRVAGGLSSGEGLIHAVRDPIVEMVPQRERGKVVSRQPETTDAGVGDKRLLAVESELSQALQSAGRDGSTLSAIIRLAWDGGPLRVLAKNAKAACLEPHISILAHITVAELQRQLTTTDRANGFANRFLWVCAARSKCLPFGGTVDEKALAELAARARLAIEFARNVGRVEFAHQTRPEWSLIYPSLSEGRPGMLGAVTARAEAQTVRLATLYALLDQSVDIKPAHLRAAMAAWRYCQDSAQFIFGNSLGDPTADEILNLLRGSDEGVTRSELMDHFKRNKTSAEIGQALAVLQSHGVAHLERRETGGRTAEVWKAIAVQNDNEEYEISEKSPP